MLMNRFQAQLLHRVEPYFEQALETAFRKLLENKHLYQNIRVEMPGHEIFQEEMMKVMSGISRPSSVIDETSRFVYDAFSIIEWKIKNQYERRSLAGYAHDTEEQYVSVVFTPQTIKLFCAECKRIEAYNFLLGMDLIEEFRGPRAFTDPISIQVFSLAFQCQSCKGVPEIFLIQREHLKLTQCGRVPMEVIELPPYLPKKQKIYHSNAIIAYNSGQVLAGSFLLRTFIEQYIRSKSTSPKSMNIDELFSEYNQNLPDDFKQRFPSLKSLYDKLSEDIHGAIASEDVFLQAKDDIEKHFKAKELFEL